MTMRYERRIPYACLMAMSALAFLQACSLQSGTPAVSREDPRRPAAAAVRQPEIGSDTAEDPLEADSAEPSVIDQILAERRRNEFPELELQESGFTITEQVRIPGDARSDYDRAAILLRDGRYAEGIEVLERIVDAAPDATVPYVDLGIAYGLIGNLERAIETLETAALLSPEHPVIHNELGILYRKTGRFAEARDSYERALAIFGGFHFARRNLAVLCDLYLADLACASENYRLYLASVGEDPEVEIWIADIDNRLGN